MKSQERWDFAQNYSAKEMIKFGYIFLVVSVFGLIFHLDEMITMIVVLSILIMGVLVLFLRVERAIKLKFGAKDQSA